MCNKRKSEKDAWDVVVDLHENAVDTKEQVEKSLKIIEEVDWNLLFHKIMEGIIKDNHDIN